MPKLPRSRDGRVEARELDGEIARGRTPAELIAPLLARAALRGGVDDLIRALALSERWIADAPDDRGAWQARVAALSRVHRFAAAREALARVRTLAGDPADWQELAAVLDEATGEHVRVAGYRADQARLYPSPRTLTHHAANLALAGELDQAIAIVPRAAAIIRDNPASLVSWLLVQWGRLYSAKGEHAAARRFYAEAHARQPLSIEAVTLLAASIHATGGDARSVLAAALADQPAHPELLALAGKRAEATQAWELHVKLLPEAYADHAARFFLADGAPARALTLARANAANRDTAEARALVLEAALAADQPAVACEIAPSLATGVRGHQFLAWRAFGACGRTADAAALAARLGI
ncbi:MAG: hypothetical protein WKG01_15600 [Kofleriaceae bacterium]